MPSASPTHTHRGEDIVWGTLPEGMLPTGGYLPPGIVVSYAGTSAPTGWLLCDGAAVSRVTYLTLFTIIGTTYGVGDGATTFNVPNLKGRVPVGHDAAQTEFDALGKTSGAKTHTLSSSEMPVHTHTQDSHNHTQNSHNHTQDAHSHVITELRDLTTGGANTNIAVTNDASSTLGTKPTASTTATNQAATATNQATTATNQNTGGGAAHNNLQPGLAINFIVKV